MSLIPEIPNMYVESFVVGLLYGLVFCTSACLPFIASYIAGIGANFRKGVFVTLIFNSGRIAAYALIGGLIGIFASAFRFVLSETSISPLSSILLICFRHSNNGNRCKYTFQEQIDFP